MHALIEIAKTIIHQYGYIGVFLLTSLDQFIFPFPLDILITISTSIGLTLKKIMPIICVATLLGASIGYLLGKFLGHPAFIKLFGKKRLDKGEIFIKKWGMPGIVVAGLAPFPFQIVTWVAGIFEIPFYKFITAVLIGRVSRYFVVALAGIFVFKTKFYATTEMSAMILGTLQGITEFLPISSSGHLVILENFLNTPISPEHLATFDIILHGGSLLAILVYFWRDWASVIKEIFIMLKGKITLKDSMMLKLILGTIPAIAGGLLFGKAIMGTLRELHQIAIWFIISAIFYFIADWKYRNGTNENITTKKSVLIGLAQAIALIPSVSRSGATIATGMLLGLKRKAAARFSFLLGGVAIMAANVYALVSIEKGIAMPPLDFVLLGFVTSFIFSLLAIAFLLKYLEKHTLRVFGIYLLIAGVLILSFM
jgi:undecaprenyl-diphosphatase